MLNIFKVIVINYDKNIDNIVKICHLDQTEILL